MNEEKEVKEAYEDDGDYEAESSAAKRGVKGKRGGKDKGKAGRLEKVRVGPPLPATVTPTTTTVPPVNVVFDEEGVTVEINNTVVPLCPPISAPTEADDG